MGGVVFCRTWSNSRKSAWRFSVRNSVKTKASGDEALRFSLDPAACGLDRAFGAIQRAVLQFQRQEPLPLIRARHGKRSGVSGREAEPSVIGRIADEQDRAEAAPSGFGDGMPRQA